VLRYPPLTEDRSPKASLGSPPLLEAQVLVERWRHEYNTFRPHSALGYRPPAPEAVEPTTAMGVR
jgi:transposase InsO family protein